MIAEKSRTLFWQGFQPFQSQISPNSSYLIIYDLPDTKAANKRRNRLHKLLSGFGQWTQYSVFECFLNSTQFASLQIKMEGIIKPDEDSVRIYILDSGAVKRTVTYGSDKPRQQQSIIL